jgi:hypothetical protein
VVRFINLRTYSTNSERIKELEYLKRLYIYNACIWIVHHPVDDLMQGIFPHDILQVQTRKLTKPNIRKQGDTYF